MKTLVVGIGECHVAKGAGVNLVTYALGSCIGIAIYDPVCNVGGLLHYLLPDSTIDAARAARNPFMFADTGIPLLFQHAYAMGAEKNRLRVFVAGGAHVLTTELFQIGKRNQFAMRRILSNAGVLISHEETGGEHSRTIRMDLDTGGIYMKRVHRRGVTDDSSGERMRTMYSLGVKGHIAEPFLPDSLEREAIHLLSETDDDQG
jgi:chemotaxis protein CheD